MTVHKRTRKTQHPPYPQNANEWRKAISKALNLTPEECDARLQSDAFPFDDLVVWIRREFRADKGYSSDFISALIRNRKGLIAWAYGGCSEPYWPGQDGESAQRF